MITREKKEKIVEELVDAVKDSESIIFTDFSGLGTTEINELKKNLREEGVRYKVTKKSLWPLILKKLGFKDQLDFLNNPGSVSIAYSKNDGIDTAKVIDNFTKSHETFKILGAIIDKVFVGPDKIRALAALPTRKELLARFVFTLNSPRQRFVSVLGVNIRNLVSVISNIKANQE